MRIRLKKESEDMVRRHDLFTDIEINSNAKKKSTLQLTNGDIITGMSYGVEPAFDDDGEELDFEYLVFTVDGESQDRYLKLDDIEKIV